MNCPPTAVTGALTNQSLVGTVRALTRFWSRAAGANRWSTDPGDVLWWSTGLYVAALGALAGVHFLGLFSISIYLQIGLIAGAGLPSAAVIAFWAGMYARDFRQLRKIDPKRAECVRSQAAFMSEVFTAFGVFLSCLTLVPVAIEAERTTLKFEIQRKYEPLREALRTVLGQTCYNADKKELELKLCKPTIALLTTDFVTTTASSQMNMLASMAKKRESRRLLGEAVALAKAIDQSTARSRHQYGRLASYDYQLPTKFWLLVAGVVFIVYGVALKIGRSIGEFPLLLAPAPAAQSPQECAPAKPGTNRPPARTVTLIPGWIRRRRALRRNNQARHAQLRRNTKKQLST